ncbi:hypothetical protein L218DRAFT_667127 [Marasmius fiardii PR-910]|nr:hypothetical protein L218DRAFT_667127 [Marasmius fiardii PR-910]
MSSPVRRLPPELLGQVFTSFREPINLLDTSYTPGKMTATLLKVCSQWRETVLSIPCLWSWLVLERKSDRFIAFSRRNERSDVRTKQRVDKILTRAGRAPLTIEIKGWVDDNEGFPQTISRILTALCSRADQWAEFHYKCWTLSLSCCINVPTLTPSISTSGLFILNWKKMSTRYRQT